MRDLIIKYSIDGLQRDGLRFSIDEVAKILKVSKKTIYKYFATKEELAVEIYKAYYESAMQEIAEIEAMRTDNAVVKVLTVYYRSHCMVRRDIFNKYSLNENIRALALANHSRIKTYVEMLAPEADRAAVMVIIDGALQKLCEIKNEENKVIEKLAGLLC